MTPAQQAEYWRKEHARLMLACDVAIGVQDFEAAETFATLAGQARLEMRDALERAQAEASADEEE